MFGQQSLNLMFGRSGHNALKHVVQMGCRYGTDFAARLVLYTKMNASTKLQDHWEVLTLRHYVSSSSGSGSSSSQWHSYTIFHRSGGQNVENFPIFKDSLYISAKCCGNLPVYVVSEGSGKLLCRV